MCAYERKTGGVEQTTTGGVSVIDAAVNWYHGYANDPRLKVLLTEIPTRNDVTFTHAGEKKMWYGESGGVAHYYYRHPDEEGNGFGGREFKLQTENNGTVTLVGPGDSRASVVNRNGLGPVIDVAMTDDPSVMRKGYTFIAGAITVDLATEAVNLLEGVTLTEPTDTFIKPTVENGYVAAVDNAVVPVEFGSDGSLSSVGDENYTVCTNVREYSNRDQWVVPVTRNDDDIITKVNHSAFELHDDDIHQTSSLV